MSYPSTLRLRLPATSANLGPGFDAVGLAMSLFLEIEADVSDEFRIAASGRDAEMVQSLERNLILETYRSVAPHAPPLAVRVHNGIPLGMGCGSSAAALVAGVQLANHFGGLEWTRQQILEEACIREGHPDNVAACFQGGLTVSSMNGQTVTAVSLGGRLPWRLILVIPSVSFATSKARALLPDTYSRADVVINLQATALLVAAFAQNRPELLKEGTRDCLHQPYRRHACPLLEQLLPLAGTAGIYSVTLSGAGPSVLLIADEAVNALETERLIVSRCGPHEVEVVMTTIWKPSEELS